jgi:2,4-dienoyl-CoA reductase-like NADH-dependent reductase (Old Yellow Enzyme family)
LYLNILLILSNIIKLSIELKSNVETDVSKLFEATTINAMTLDNRFVRSATWEGMADDDGACTPKLTDTLAQLAAGGVGLVITGHAYVRKIGQAGPWQLGMDRDQLIPGLYGMAEAVHNSGGKIITQLAHAGLFANPKYTKQMPMAPSSVGDFTPSPPLEMTPEDIRDTVTAFGLAAERSRIAGFDGVQIHSAHGYLLSQFLSPAFNRREDRYGGSIENRARIHVEVADSIRKHAGRDYPILIKMNSRDFIEGGLDLEDSVKAAQIFQEAGIDGIEISGGTGVSGKLTPVRTGIVSEDKEAYFKTAAMAFKKNIDIPIILVGGIRSFHVSEEIVNENVADYISMSRPFIREPGLVNRWKAGDREPATCLSDNKCFSPAMTGKGIHCVVEKRLGKKE